MSCVTFSMLAWTAVNGCNGPEPLNLGNSNGAIFQPPGGLVTRIQTGEFYQGTTLVFEAIVTGIEYATDPSYDPIGITGMYVSDILVQAAPYSGIYVNLAITEVVDHYSMGDHLLVTGHYVEYYGGSQISESDIVKLGTQLDTPGVPKPVEPAVIEDSATIATQFIAGSSDWSPTTNHGPDGEQYEGVLVRVENVEIITRSLGHGMFAVTGGLAIDKQLHYWQGSRSVGTRFASITGVLSYTFDAFKLAPRSVGDFVLQ